VTSAHGNASGDASGNASGDASGDASSVPLSLGVCIYGIAYSAGMVGRGTPRANPRPLDATGFLHLAAELGLNSVEVPLPYIHPTEDLAALRAYVHQAHDLGLRVVSAGVPIEEDAFRHHLHTLHNLGIRTVRCVLSSVLCGDRRPIGGLEGWQRHLAGKIDTLRAIAPLAEKFDIRIGVENHQDATSTDLIHLCETVGSPSVGITLDTGNPLAVAEDPVAFAPRWANATSASWPTTTGQATRHAPSTQHCLCCAAANRPKWMWNGAHPGRRKTSASSPPGRWNGWPKASSTCSRSSHSGTPSDLISQRAAPPPQSAAA